MNENMSKMSERGRRAAMNGILEEKRVVEELNNWTSSEEGRKWLNEILERDGLELNQIAAVSACGIGGKLSKTDVQLQVATNDSVERTYGIQVKKLSGRSSGHQIDRRSPESFGRILGMPDKAIEGLKEFTGDGGRRKYMEDIDPSKREVIADFFRKRENLDRFFNFILKGNDESLAPQYTILIQECRDEDGRKIRKSILLSEEEILNEIRQDDTLSFPPRRKDGSRQGIRIGGITLQRKGGRPNPENIQCKCNIGKLFF